MVLVSRLWTVFLMTRLWNIVAARNTVLKTLRLTYTNTGQEQKLCTALPLRGDREEYIVTFDPKASPDHVLHLSVQVCMEIPSQDRVWSCGETPSCVGRPRPVYVWGRNSSTWRLPPETAIPVGGRPEETYIVLMAHVKASQSASPPQKQTAEVVLRISNHSPRFEVGLMILGNTGYIPAHTEKFVSESACQWKSHQSALVLGYRLLTRTLGKWVDGYKVTGDDWQLIGQGAPLSTENVHRSFKKQILEYDDYLIARCYYENLGSKPVAFGPGYTDEVCNLHVLYIFPHGTSPSLRFRACVKNSQNFRLTDVFQKVPREKGRLSGKERGVVNN